MSVSGLILADLARIWSAVSVREVCGWLSTVKRAVVLTMFDLVAISVHRVLNMSWTVSLEIARDCRNFRLLFSAFWLVCSLTRLE